MRWGKVNVYYRLQGTINKVEMFTNCIKIKLRACEQKFKCAILAFVFIKTICLILSYFVFVCQLSVAFVLNLPFDSPQHFIETLKPYLDLLQHKMRA